MLSKAGEIRRDEACLDYAGQDVILYPCHGSKGNQLWRYEPSVRVTISLIFQVNVIKFLKVSKTRFQLCFSLLGKLIFD